MTWCQTSSGQQPRFPRKDMRGVTGAPERIRTSGLWLRRPTLYPPELQARAWIIATYASPVNRPGPVRAQPILFPGRLRRAIFAWIPISCVGGPPMDLSRLGKLGVWTFLDAMTAPQAAEFAGRIEALGYSALWHPEAVGRDPVALIGFLAPQTSRLVFATGIANIYARDPMTANAARLTLGELTGGRFILGLGVSHAHLVAGVRKHEYGKPVSTMRAYLEAM